MKTFFKIVVVGFFIYFTSWFVVYKTGINTLAIQSEDTIPALFLPFSILKENTLYLDTYYQLMIERYPHPDDKSYQKGLTPFYLKKVGTHYVSAFTIITPLLVLPIYIIPVLLNVTVDWNLVILLSHISAALLMSLAGGFFYLLLQTFNGLENKLSKGKILTLVTIYLFGTVNYAMLSQSLWQHGTLQLLTLIGMYTLFRGLYYKNSTQWFFYSGLFFGLAILCRPTGALLVFGLILYGFFYLRKNSFSTRKYLLLLLLGLLINVVFFLWYNKTFYIDIRNQGYTGQLFNSWRWTFPWSFLGIWFSPSKGIIIYSPIFIFSFLGALTALKTKNTFRSLYVTFIVLILAHTFVMSLWKHWYGGYSFGYRMSSDVLPLLVFMIIPFMQSNLFEKYKRLFLLLFIFSIFVQIFGIIFFDSIWHSAYDKGFVETSWLWSIKNSEFVFNVRRVLVKLGLLQKACELCLPVN